MMLISRLPSTWLPGVKENVGGAVVNGTNIVAKNES